MKIIEEHGNDEIARVYVAQLEKGMVEFVESVQPPVPREEKWVLIISTLYGCPVGCSMCDAGGDYRGKLTKDEMISQIEHIVTRRYPDRIVPAGRFKVQFARMGEPALNPAVLDVLDALPDLYNAPGLLPSISTIAPVSADDFFQRLVEVKNDKYGGGMFQLQFSIHSTSEKERDRLIPVKKWSLGEISEYGRMFRKPGDRKVTLNFAAVDGAAIEPSVLASTFDPKDFLIKITPLNPTARGSEYALASGFDPERPETARGLVESMEDVGFQTILSIGELEENNIGSNCGQYVQRIKYRANSALGQ